MLCIYVYIGIHIIEIKSLIRIAKRFHQDSNDTECERSNMRHEQQLMKEMEKVEARGSGHTIEHISVNFSNYIASIASGQYKCNICICLYVYMYI